MKILRAGDYTKLKNSVAQLRRDARTFSATKAEHDREMDTLKKELLFARRGVISEYSATTMQRTRRIGDVARGCNEAEYHVERNAGA